MIAAVWVVAGVIHVLHAYVDRVISSTWLFSGDEGQRGGPLDIGLLLDGSASRTMSPVAKIFERIYTISYIYISLLFLVKIVAYAGYILYHII